MSLSSEQRTGNPYSLPTVGGIFGVKDHDRFLQSDAQTEFERWFPATIKNRARSSYETGVDALAGILQPLLNEQNRLRLWSADNFCQDSLLRLQTKLDHRIDLLKYHRTDDLQAVFAGDVVLYLHFNRYESASVDTITAIRNQGALVIEDFVQAPLDITKFTGDFAFNSLRKYSSLDLSIAYGDSLASASRETSRYWSIRKQAESARSRFVEDPNHERELEFLSLARASEAALDTRQIYAGQSTEIHRAMSFGFTQTLERRQKNYQQLARRLRAADPEVEILPGDYMYLMIATPQRDQLRAHLFKQRIFPVIHWVDSGSERSREILSFHIDHRYDSADMHRVADAVAEFRQDQARVA